MTVFTDTLAVAASGMRAQTERIRHVSENIANSDTPGYHRKTISFQSVMESGHATGEIMAGRVRLDQSAPQRVYDPSNPLADDSGYYDGSNVNLLLEIADAREAQRSYEANLKMFDQIRQMSSSLLELLRR